MLQKSFIPLTVTILALLQPVALAQTATYYSDEYQGQPTASGELFNTWDYTAAHPNLPFGTWVEVTNLNNGSSVTVRINVRCNCGIDLSKAAAVSIDLIDMGVAPVSLKILEQ
ncbi:MAG: septal ring lytic transglycosylase RlpA family protein [Acaryochloridaceae cyanobacterium SU_2_1]|nr:septal ring lytic transglycosylase RlpA family protein [Acaryochloridaceae cyanobacterium SU_2_1]NJM95384.1 septal ring lytic transglycosylase RlpA family protein [Acaryochloridaceae cyanobacterium CSU_5_19]